MGHEQERSLRWVEAPESPDRYRGVPLVTMLDNICTFIIQLG